MSPRAVRVVTILTAFVLMMIGLALMLASCTLVYIEGDGNSISDTGGHGGGLTIPQQQTGMRNRLQELRQDR